MRPVSRSMCRDNEDSLLLSCYPEDCRYHPSRSVGICRSLSPARYFRSPLTTYRQATPDCRFLRSPLCPVGIQFDFLPPLNIICLAFCSHLSYFGYSARAKHFPSFAFASLAQPRQDTTERGYLFLLEILEFRAFLGTRHLRWKTARLLACSPSHPTTSLRPSRFDVFLNAVVLSDISNEHYC